MEQEGVWRTIRGAKVFIKDGENVSDALKRKKSNERKQKQFEIIQKTNPMRDDYHVGIRKPEDIQTFAEAVENMERDEAGVYPDVTEKDYQRALKSGEIVVYSSKVIKNGTFVSPSKMMASDYAGGEKVYQLKIQVDDVAWINADEGIYAKI